MIVEERVACLARAVSRLSLEVFLRVEEHDPQFKAVSTLVLGLGDQCKAALLAVGNALISYRLSRPGEEYWEEFSRTALRRYSENPDLPPTVFFEEFLQSSRGNRIGVEAKLKRIRRMSVAVTPRDVCMACSNLEDLWRRLSAVMGARPSAKTIVFAVKMAYYACRAMGLNPTIPMHIDIPVDSRISMLAATSGIVNHMPWRTVWRIVYEKEPGVARQAWRLVADASGIPPLHLDAVLWLSARSAREAGYRREKAISLAYNYLSMYSGMRGEGLMNLCRELFFRMQ